MDSSTGDSILIIVIAVLCSAILIGGAHIGDKSVRSSSAYKIGAAVIEECGKPASVCEYEYFNGDNNE